MLGIILFLLYYGVFVLKGEDYYYISIGIMVTGILGFLLSFEKSKPTTAMLAIVAALCGLAIASRIGFAFAPQMKPMAAIIIITAVTFGAETGFVAGAVSAFVTNFYFGHGPWTFYQMFGLGMVGFVAGLLFSKKKNRLVIALYGFLSVVIIYGGIVDLNTIFYNSHEWNPAVAISVYTVGLPFNAMYGLATAVFLFVLYQPIMKKLSHLTGKYRIIDKEEKK